MTNEAIVRLGEASVVKRLLILQGLNFESIRKVRLVHIHTRLTFRILSNIDQYIYIYRSIDILFIEFDYIPVSGLGIGLQLLPRPGPRRG